MTIVDKILIPQRSPRKTEKIILKRAHSNFERKLKAKSNNEQQLKMKLKKYSILTSSLSFSLNCVSCLKRVFLYVSAFLFNRKFDFR